MAYLKYKELTKYFYFYKRLDIDTLPKYVTDYIINNEKIYEAYATKRDKGIFTNKRIILFDIKMLNSVKQIHVIPYSSISTIAINFYQNSASLLIYVESGYPLTLKFRNLKAEEKTILRILYTRMNTHILDK